MEYISFSSPFSIFCTKIMINYKTHSMIKQTELWRNEKDEAHGIAGNSKAKAKSVWNPNIATYVMEMATSRVRQNVIHATKIACRFFAFKNLSVFGDERREKKTRKICSIRILFISTYPFSVFRLHLFLYF